MFNEAKFKKCINHLIEIKVCIVLFFCAVFAVVGIGVGYFLETNVMDNILVIVISGVIGGIIGILIGAFETWRVEMKIQEANWKIDVLNELKKQSQAKNTPIAKTVVAIENKSDR